jgi:hypothetical protein
MASVCSQETTTGLLKLEGVAVNSLTGKPLPRVLVQFANRAVLTGPEGEFSFDQVQPGPVQLLVTKPGFFGLGSRMHAPAMVSADWRADSPRLVVKLVPEAVLFGQVTGRDEEPVEGALVQALSLNSDSGSPHLGAMYRGTRTDENGNYRLAGLPAGRYYLEVKTMNLTRRSPLSLVLKAQETYPPEIYYPGTSDLASAVKVEIAPGQRQEASFRIAPVPGYRVAGVVEYSRDWSQILPPMILDSLGQMIIQPDTFEAASGKFEFRSVPEGAYTLRVAGQDAQGDHHSSDHQITVTQAVSGLKLALQAGIDIPVAVRAEFSTPRQPGSCSRIVPGGEGGHTDCSDYPAAFVELINLDPSSRRYATNFAPLKDASSSYLRGVAAGKYLVRARPSFGGYIQSLRSASLDLLREPLVVPEAGSVATIEVVVRDDVASLKVEVRSDEPLVNGMIMVVPEGELRPEPQMIASGRGPEFSYDALAPGTYKVFAFELSEGIDLSNPETLAKYASNAASVTVAANDKATVVVQAIHNGE